jgi:hypothetical protein
VGGPEPSAGTVRTSRTESVAAREFPHAREDLGEPADEVDDVYRELNRLHTLSVDGKNGKKWS